MRTRLALGLVVIAVAGTALISYSTLSSIPDYIQAYAGAALNPEDVAKTMRVRVSESGHQQELVFGSFSRIGFVAESSSDFLLESLPSEDKKPFYRFVQESLQSSKNPLANPTLLDINIDLFSGDFDLIETLSYEDCRVVDYFVHAVDSRGKYQFLEDEDSPIEIREVTKFSCNSFNIIIEE